MKEPADLSTPLHENGFVSGHGFSRVSMNLRLTQGDENRGEAVFDCAVTSHEKVWALATV